MFHSMKRLPIIGLIIGIILFGGFAGYKLSHRPKETIQGAGFATQLSQQFQQFYSTTTPGVTSTTIATVPIVAVTSSIHLVVDATANGTTSTLAAGFHCVGDFKRSSTTVDIIIQTGTTSCTTNKTVSLAPTLQVDFATSSGNILVQVAGSAANTIDWGALVNYLNIQ